MQTEQTNAMIINEKDHVITVVVPVTKGTSIVWKDTKGTHTITALDDIPLYHKAACSALKKGENILKYGEIIGHATQDIRVGEWVHTHNLSDFPEEV